MKLGRTWHVASSPTRWTCGRDAVLKSCYADICIITGTVTVCLNSTRDRKKTIDLIVNKLLHSTLLAVGIS